MDRPHRNDYIRAAWQWFSLGVLIFIGFFVGAVIVYPLAIAWLKFKYQYLGMPLKPNPYGELFVEHRKKYKDSGSSGLWEYWDIGGLFWWWGNLEDGFLGEPSGKHSAREDGKEKTFIAMYRWSIRNNCNNLKRQLLGCDVNKCVIQWWGSGEARDGYGSIILNDNEPLKRGWYFVKATHNGTGKVYYGYRSVREAKPGKVWHTRLGFKIKPRHAYEHQSHDDAMKGFTIRRNYANVN